jgi:hypothetical protein
MVSAAGRLRRAGFTLEAATAALVQQNRDSYQGVHATDDDEVARLVTDVFRRYRGDPFDADGVEGIAFSTDDASGEKPSGDRLELRRLQGVAARQTRWHTPGTIPLGALTLVAGIGGLGKSTWAIAVAARASRGELGPPSDTILVSFEDPAAEVLRPRAEAAGADLDRIHTVVVNGIGTDMVSLPRDVDELRRLVQTVSAGLVVIDPVVAAFAAALDTHKDQHVRLVLAQLTELCEQEACAVALIGHLNKSPSTDAYLRVSNSVAFWNAARSVVLVTEDPGEPESGRLVAQRKANWGRRATVERHRLEEVLLDTTDPNTGLPIVTSKMVFVEFADDIDANDVLASPARDTRTDAAETFLAAALADGDWHDSAGLKSLAGAQMISERTLKRAAQELGVEHERRGFASPSTYWRLPSGPR